MSTITIRVMPSDRGFEVGLEVSVDSPPIVYPVQWLKRGQSFDFVVNETIIPTGGGLAAPFFIRGEE